MLCLRRRRLGNGRGLLRGGGAGLGDAGNEALGQLGGTLQGAAGVAADVLEGGERDHEGEDAPCEIAWINDSQVQPQSEVPANRITAYSAIDRGLAAAKLPGARLQSLAARTVSCRRRLQPQGARFPTCRDQPVWSFNCTRHALSRQEHAALPTAEVRIWHVCLSAEFCSCEAACFSYLGTVTEPQKRPCPRSAGVCARMQEARRATLVSVHSLEHTNIDLW
jgi:hypothetical protein